MIFNIKGGLGNQLFQYAFARQFSERPILDLSWFKNQGDATAREFQLEKYFDLPYLVCPISLAKIVRRVNRTSFSEKKEYSYDNDAFNMVNIYYSGYWQSIRYLNGISSDAFHFKYTALSDEIVKYENTIKESKVSISLHIRRGDYLSNVDANTTHGLLSLDYYYNALKYLKEKWSCEKLDIFVFSDDPVWVLNEFELSEFGNINVVSETNELDDLYLMSLTKANIIANSTFSWWGAYLNKNKNKIVIAPNNWLADGRDCSELFFDDWVVI